MEHISWFIIVVYFCKFSIFVKSQVHTISQTMTTVVTCPAHGFITCSNYMKNGSKSWKAKKGNRESREHESWDKEPQSPLFTGSRESTNHEIRSPNPPSLQCHLMCVLQGAIQQLNLVDHNDIYKDIYVTTCKNETNICI